MPHAGGRDLRQSVVRAAGGLSVVIVPIWAWLAVIGGLLVVLAFDLWIVDRGEPREFSLKQAGFWVSFYVTLAVIFGIVLWIFAGPTSAGQFFAGYITEYSLSVDN